MKKLLLLLAVLLLPVCSKAQVVDTVLYDFASTAYPCVANPGSDAPVNHAGNIFGVASGDDGNCANTGAKGAVWEWVVSSGTWNLIASVPCTPTSCPSTVLDNPTGPLAFDSNQNIFGTSTGTGGEPCGSIYEISYSSSTHTWNTTPTILYTFTGAPDGCTAESGVILDAAGNIYGVTRQGGSTAGSCGNGCGIVYELKKAGTGYSSTLTILHTFTGAPDGSTPLGSLNMDTYTDALNEPQVHLWGLASAGGSTVNCTSGCGTLFEITVATTGLSTTYNSVYSFAGGTSDGAQPQGGLYFNQLGWNLIGTTNQGGTNGQGTLFAYNVASGTETVIHNFQCTTTDVCSPQGPVIADGHGNVYGTGVSGGTDNYGGVFEEPVSGLPASYSVVYSFLSGTGDGQNPSPGCAIVPGGTTLYCTTTYGGTGTIDNHSAGVLASIPE